MTEIFTGLICRPPRKSYSVDELGPSKFLIQEQMCVRVDMELVNRRQLKLKCSHYLPVDANTMKVSKPLPCVVYLHGNSGSRIDADDIVDSYLSEGIAVFSIDFGGCGLSDGDFVTLGWRERDDLECVLDYLSADKNTACITLFGRSMGAATALLVASDDRYYHMIRGMVLDSCYTSVRQVLLELANKYVGKVPLVPFASMVDKAVDLLREAVLHRAGFDLDAVNVIQAARHCSSPVLFGHADDDQLVLASHTKNLFAEYGGEKLINVFEGDHNSIRPKAFQDQALSFLQRCFKDAMKEPTPPPSPVAAAPARHLPPSPDLAPGKSSPSQSSARPAEGEGEGETATAEPGQRQGRWLQFLLLALLIFAAAVALCVWFGPPLVGFKLEQALARVKLEKLATYRQPAPPPPVEVRVAPPPVRQNPFKRAWRMLRGKQREELQSKMGVLDGINRKHKTSVQKRNIKLRQNRGNRVAKQEAAPKLTTKTISKKKQRQLNKGKGKKLHTRHLRVKSGNTMETDGGQDEEVSQQAEKMDD